MAALSDDYARDPRRFLPHQVQPHAPNLQQDIGHVNVFRIDGYRGNSTTPVPYSRRDFYKISLIRGHNVYHYADKSIEVNGPVLLFFSPHVPYTWESLSGSMNAT